MKINLEYYRARARKLASVNTDPSETDQTGAEETNINVIVKRYGVYGTIPQGSKAPIFGADTTDWPTDLGLAIDLARSLEKIRGELPPAMQKMSTDELLALTPEKIVSILKPPAPVGDNKEPTQ